MDSRAVERVAGRVVEDRVVAAGEPWARVLALILAFLDLINVPFGTALGVYTLWVLLPAQSEEDYEKYLGAAA